MEFQSQFNNLEYTYAVHAAASGLIPDALSLQLWPRNKQERKGGTVQDAFFSKRGKDEKKKMLVAKGRTSLTVRQTEGIFPGSQSFPLCVPQNLRPFSKLDLMIPMMGVAPEHTRQLLLEGPVRMKEGREGKVRR